jgi:polyisoprenyl-phosphate glycosyltransferase
VFGEKVPGYPSLVIGLMVLGGVQLIMIGIMGEYLGKILSELKARPVYFVADHSVRTAEGAGEVGDPPARSAAE